MLASDVQEKIRLAKEQGFSDDEIQASIQRLSAPTPSPTTNMINQTRAGALQTQPQEQPGGFEGFLRGETLPFLGSLVGGIGGGVLAGAGTFGVGAVGGGIAGAGVGGGAGEALRRGLLRIMGEDPDEDDPADAGSGTQPENAAMEDLKAILWAGGTSAAGQAVGGAVGKVAGKALSGGAKTIGKLTNINPSSMMHRGVKMTGKEMANANRSVGQPGTTAAYDELLKHGITGDPEQMLLKLGDTQNRIMQQRDSILAAAGQRGIRIPSSRVRETLEKDIVDSLYLPNSKQFATPQHETMAKHAKEQIDYIMKNFPDEMTPSQVNDIRKSMYQVVSKFDAANFDRSEINRRLGGAFKGILDDLVPEATELNRSWSLLEHAKPALERGALPGMPMQGWFGSAIQSAGITGGAMAVGGPVGAAGGLAYTGTVLANQAIKDPKVATKIGQIMYNTGRMGDEAPGILRRFYNKMTPVVRGARDNSGAIIGATGASVYRAANKGGSTSGEGGIPETPDGQAALLNSLIRDPHEVGMATIPGEEYMDESIMFNSDNPLIANVRDFGLTKKQAAVAMLMFPTQREAIKDIYEILQDPAEEYEMSAEDRKQLGKIDSAYGMVRSAEEMMSQIKGTGRVAGRATQALGAVGLDPIARKYNDWREAMKAPLARAISGEVGTLTDRDIARADGLIPRLTDTPEEIRMGFTMIERTLDERLQQLSDRVDIKVKSGTEEDTTSEEDLYDTIAPGR